MKDKYFLERYNEVLEKVDFIIKKNNNSELICN